MATITFGNTAWTIFGGSSSPRTYAFNNNKDCLILLISSRYSIGTPTYNSVGMTQIYHCSYNDNHVWGYRLTGAAQGSNQVSYTITGYGYEKIYLASLENVSPSGPVGDIETNTENGSYQHNRTLTTKSGDLCFFHANWYNYSKSGIPQYSTTERVDQDGIVGNGNNRLWVGSKAATTTSTQLGVNKQDNQTSWCAYAAFALQPVTPGNQIIFFWAKRLGKKLDKIFKQPLPGIQSTQVSAGFTRKPSGLLAPA